MLDPAVLGNNAADQKSPRRRGKVSFHRSSLNTCLVPYFRDRQSQIDLTSKHALDERGGFDELARARKPRCLKQHVIHIGSYLLLGAKPRQTPLERSSNLFRLHVSSSSHSVGESGLDL